MVVSTWFRRASCEYCTVVGAITVSQVLALNILQIVENKNELISRELRNFIDRTVHETDVIKLNSTYFARNKKF